MQLASILIGGIERIQYTLLRDFELVKDSGDRMGTAKMLVLYNPDAVPAVGSAVVGESMLGIGIVPGQQVDIYRTSEGTESEEGLFGGFVFGEELFGSGPASSLEFSGTITNIEEQVMVARRTVTDGGGVLFGEPEFGGPLFGEGPSYERVNIYRLECRDWNSILENGIVPLGTAGFTNKTDQYIIQQLFGSVAPEVDLSLVASTATLTTFEQVEGQSLRALVQRLSEMTGAVYYIDQEKKFHWQLPSASPAPFSLSEEPDLTTSFGFDRPTFRYVKEWRTPANRVTVMGAVSTGGTRVSETLSDTGSIAAYGLFSRTISDRTITSSSAAKARARVELANYAYPQYSGRAVIRKFGLEVGQLLPIDASTSLRLNGSFVVRRITLRWWTRSVTNYDIEWGSYLPDLARAIRMIYDKSGEGQPTGVQPTTPAPGSVDTGAYVPGSIDNAALGIASVGSANIQNLAVGNAHIQNAAIEEAQIADLAVSNAKISDLSATKLNTDDLTVGGTTHPGKLAVLDGSGAAYGYIGGSTDGGWLKALGVGGSGISTAKLKVSSSGDFTINFTGASDDFTLVNPSNGLTVKIAQSGIKVYYASDTATYTQIDQTGFIMKDSSGGEAWLSTNAGNGFLSLGGLQVVAEKSTGWTAMTGTATKGGGDTSTITLAQLAQVVKALTDALTTHGLIGT